MVSYEEVEHRYRHLLSARFRGWEVGAGWLTLLQDVLHELDQVAPDAKITQIKEKMGLLRVYVEDKTKEVAKEALRRAEIRSGMICENCGEPGELIGSEGWLRVRCPDHRDQDDVG